MNNKGQSLIIFIILIPFILFAFAFLYDYMMVLYEQKKLDNINFSAIVHVFEKEEQEIKEIIYSNDSDIEINYYIESDNVLITLEKEILRIFDTYKLKSYYTAYYNDGDIYIERGN